MKIDKKEVLRYMRAKDGGDLDAVIGEISDILTKKLTPLSIGGVFDIEQTEDGVILIPSGVKFSGELIKKRLKKAEKVALLAVTLGIQSESLLTAFASDMSRALVADACMTAMVESFLDDAEQDIREGHEKDGYFVSGRFSPGYGDFSLSAQRDILKLLNAEKNIGLYMKESYMLYPNKSVTAVIGIGKSPASAEPRCSNCRSECGYKKED